MVLFEWKIKFTHLNFDPQDVSILFLQSRTDSENGYNALDGLWKVRGVFFPGMLK